MATLTNGLTLSDVRGLLVSVVVGFLKKNYEENNKNGVEHPNRGTIECDVMMLRYDLIANADDVARMRCVADVMTDSRSPPAQSKRRVSWNVSVQK